MKRSIVLALFLVSATASVGCSAGPSDAALAGDEQNITAGGRPSSADETAKLVALFEAAVEGIDASRGEGGPDGKSVPYHIVAAHLDERETMDFALLAERVGSRIPSLSDAARGEGAYSFDSRWSLSVEQFWKRATAIDSLAYEQDPEREESRSDRMKALKSLCEDTFVEMVNVTLGRTEGSGKSIETGAVAHALIGRTADGTLIAIYTNAVWN